MGLLPEQVQDILGILAGILHLGNINFVSAAGAQIENRLYLEAAARLFSIDTYRLGDALTQKFMVLRGEEITTPLTKEQVCHMYTHCVPTYAHITYMYTHYIHVQILHTHYMHAHIKCMCTHYLHVHTLHTCTDITYTLHACTH